MIQPLAATRSGGTDDLYCERCGAPAGPLTTLGRVGLSRCVACGVHACQRCWARATAGCPGCGAAAARGAIVGSRASSRASWSRPRSAWSRPRPVSPAAVAGAGADRPISPGRPRQDRSAAVAAAMVVVALFAFAFIVSGPLRPTGGFEGAVEGAVGTPGTGAAGSVRPDVTRRSPAPAGGGETVRVPVATQNGPTTPTSEPAPIMTATPTRTPAPTPGATPVPTPRTTPVPTPCVVEAPQLVGERRRDAPGIWHAAGFTGDVTALPGNGNYVIGTQDPAAGLDLPCDTPLTVGP